MSEESEGRRQPPPRPPPPQQHWTRGHRSTCKAHVLSEAAQAKVLRESQKAVEADKCLVCLEPPTNPTSLACGHVLCTNCVASLRSSGVSDVCLLCREPLPPGAQKLFEMGEWAGGMG